MKKILPILLCYVLMTSQVFAISGGPVFGGAGLNPVGTYSGVISVDQELDFDNPVVDPVTGNLVPSMVADVNAIGLFDLAVTQTNVSTGSFLLFVDGIVYTGDIVASINPDSDQLSGIVNGTFQYTVVTIVDTTSISTTFTSLANGKITASISGTRQGSLSSASLVGSSSIDVDRMGIADGSFVTDTRLNCTVTGFRQSLTPSASAITFGQ